MLPPEILLRIVDFAHDHIRRPFADDITHKPGIGTLLSIILVCKEWSFLAEPLLYQEIELNYHSWPTERGNNQLLRENLKKYPHRNNYIQDLKLDCSVTNNEEDVAELLNNLRRMSGLRELWLAGPRWQTSENASIAAEIGSLCIRSLSMTGWWTSSILEYIMTTDRDQVFSALESMNVSNAVQLKDGCRLRSHRQNTSKLDVIDIGDDCHPETVYELLKWPMALGELELGNGYNCPSTSSLQKSLDVQSESLDTLTVDSYPDRPFSRDAVEILPRLTHFSSLTHITFNSRNVFHTPPRYAAESLSCGCLTRFGIDMDTFLHDDAIDLKCLREDQAKWILEFSTYYRKFNPNGSLKIIDLSFGHLDQYEISTLRSEGVWPGACFKSLEPKIAELGVRLRLWTNGGFEDMYMIMEKMLQSDRED